MAWVTLSLRKMELVHLHNDLEVEDLQISRELRRMARDYQLKKRRAMNESREEQSELTKSWKNQRESLTAQYENAEDRSDYMTAYNNAKVDYDEQLNFMKSQQEDSVADIEAEAAEVESQLQDEKIQIETQMEAVAEEMKAIEQQISTDIQSETIKLH